MIYLFIFATSAKIEKNLVHLLCPWARHLTWLPLHLSG